MREKNKTISLQLFNSIEDIAISEVSALGEIKLSSAEYTLLAMFTTGTRVAQLVNSQKNTSKVPKTISNFRNFLKFQKTLFILERIIVQKDS